MPRQTPPGRTRAVALAACEVFMEKGYRRTLMTDVGAELELSHALLYRYVDSKEALFELALLYAMDPEAVSTLETPLPTPAPGHIVDMLARWAKERASFPTLKSALASEHPPDVTQELADIIDERYQFTERNWKVLALIEQSALDLPDLYAFYFTKGRRTQIRLLADYLERRIATGDLRAVSNVEVAARFVIESIAWFAWHRKADLDSEVIDDGQAHLTVRELLLATFIPERNDQS